MQFYYREGDPPITWSAWTGRQDLGTGAEAKARDWDLRVLNRNAGLEGAQWAVLEMLTPTGISQISSD